ncbi:hypothetical protein VNO80_00155 [Phaseolus coccineus]|uniref:Uncharacterized protein n=1 Tax=Phaseolus coccineus TaxID=3886 RepID=A0AAN9P3P0_PHACN
MRLGKLLWWGYFIAVDGCKAEPNQGTTQDKVLLVQAACILDFYMFEKEIGAQIPNLEKHECVVYILRKFIRWQLTKKETGCGAWGLGGDSDRTTLAISLCCQWRSSPLLSPSGNISGDVELPLLDFPAAGNGSGAGG